MAGSGVWANPNILFYVSDKAPFDGPEPQRQLEEQLDDLHIVQRRKRDITAIKKPEAVRISSDGHHILRKHIIMAKL